MDAGRLARLAALALMLAVVPGALRLLPDHPAPDRAEATAVPLASSSVYADEVAISAPATFTGPVADAGPLPAGFDVPRGGAGGVYALVIGIDDYPGSSGDLTSAVADADTIDAALTGFGVPAGNRVVLRDGQARKGAVVAAIQQLAALGGPSATLVFAYAGHARKLDADTEALVTAEGDLLTDQELAGLLAPVRARTWLLLATCFAGGFTEATGPGRVLTAAADASSLAYESPALRASYLVHHLVREGWLQGRAGASVQDAFAYADAQMAAQNPERRPVQVDGGGGPLVLGAGDPTTAFGLAPQPDAPPTTTTVPPAGPPSTAPPRPERECSLLVLCSG